MSAMIRNQFVQDLIASPFHDTYVPKHQLGPDYIIPTNENRTWKVDGAVRIIEDQEKDSRFKPTSVITYFKNAVDNSPDKPALIVRRNGEILKWTYLQYWHAVRIVAKAFIKLGLTPFKAVAILACNSPEWLISYLAAIFCGGLPTGVYTTNSADACHYILENSSANIIVVDTQEQLEKVLSIRHKLPELKTIIQFIGNSNSSDVILWEDLFPIGKTIPDDVLEKRIKGVAINQCCTLVYTSGTTGYPKSVMLSHDGVIFSAKSIIYKISHPTKYGKCVSYLPLSHAAAMEMDFYMSIHTESALHFAHPDALKGKLLEDLTRVQPNFFFGVPRVLEKIMEKLIAAEKDLPPLKKKLISWARKQALAYNLHISDYTSKPIQYLIASKFILSKVKEALGLQDVKDFACGGAPISPDVIQFYLSYDIPLHEAFGLSESSGAHTVTTPRELFRLGSNGNVQTVKNCQFKVSNPETNGSGEFLIRGRNLFMGYLGLEEETKEVLDENKWFNTGDYGFIDKDGFLFVTGRIKELIITSGGENIPPVLIENHIKRILPVISNCMVVGDKRKYLVILLTLKTEVNLSTMEPTDKLSPLAVNWCQSVGSDVKSVSEILQTNDFNVVNAIQKGIDEYNDNFAISRPQRIQKWSILPQDFCIHNGTFGPTSKLKRPFVVKKYHDIIEAMYR